MKNYKAQSRHAESCKSRIHKKSKARIAYLMRKAASWMNSEKIELADARLSRIAKQLKSCNCYDLAEVYEKLQASEKHEWLELFVNENEINAYMNY